MVPGGSGPTLATSNNSMNKAEPTGGVRTVFDCRRSNTTSPRCCKVRIERRRTWEMGTWLIGLSLVAAGFVMGMVLMALLVATHRTDLR